MKIFYSDIEEDITPVEASFTFTEEGETIEVKDFHGELMKTGEESFFLRGEMASTLHCLCDRCTNAAVIDIQQQVAVTIEPEKAKQTATTGNDEYEMTDDDGEIYLTDPEFIDLEEILRQEAVLQLPLKRLCSADCKGIEHKDDDDTDMPARGLEALKKLKK